MYDAKIISDESYDNLRYNCIEDRSYFTKVKNECIAELKSNYIPVENIDFSN